MMNLKIRSLEDTLINDLNNSDIPVEAKRYVLLNLLHLTEKEADKAILAEMQKTESVKEEGEYNAEST